MWTQPHKGGVQPSCPLARLPLAPRGHQASLCQTPGGGCWGDHSGLYNRQVNTTPNPTRLSAFFPFKIVILFSPTILGFFFLPLSRSDLAPGNPTGQKTNGLVAMPTAPSHVASHFCVSPRPSSISRTGPCLSWFPHATAGGGGRGAAGPGLWTMTE